MFKFSSSEAGVEELEGFLEGPKVLKSHSPPETSSGGLGASLPRS